MNSAIIIDPKTPEGIKEFDRIRNDFQPIIKDVFDLQASELRVLFEKRLNGKKSTRLQSDNLFEDVWVYFPWKNVLIHMLNEQGYFLLRTARNYPLISYEVQHKLNKLCIGVVGLSVGNSVALALTYMGIGHYYKLADFDTLETSNLNRVRASVVDIGEKKVDITARQIYECNPFAKIEVFPAGLNASNLEDYFKGSKNLDIVYDECDDLVLKFYLRVAAQSLKVPLIMASDVGYSLDVSYEDFSQKKSGEAKIPFVEFENVVDGLSKVEELNISKADKILLIEELLGADNISDEMKLAILELSEGKIESYPQLGPIAFMSGGLAALTTLAAQQFGLSTKSSAKFKIMDQLVDYPESWITAANQWKKRYAGLIKSLKKE